MKVEELDTGARKRIEKRLKKHSDEDRAQAMRCLGIEPNGNHDEHKSRRPSHVVAGHQRTRPLAVRF